MAKHSKEHYLVKNQWLGYRCTICGVSNRDIKQIKQSPCRPMDREPGSDGQVSVDEVTAQQMMLDELRELEQEGLMLEGLLKEEQEQLEELMLLDQLENMEKELRDQEDADLLAAKALSLEQSCYPKVAASRSKTEILQEQEDADLREARALSLEQSCYPKFAASSSKTGILQDQEEADLREARALSLEGSCYANVAAAAPRKPKRRKEHSFVKVRNNKVPRFSKESPVVATAVVPQHTPGSSA